MTSKNIMVVGVGGQGSLLASKLLGLVFIKQGYDVKVSEVHGMSQRGGSVVTFVSCADKVYSPVIDEGESDFIIAFELLEAARWISYLKAGGRLIANSQQIDPMPVIVGAKKYPDELADKIKEAGIYADIIDGLKLAVEAGSPKAVNVVLLGRLSLYLKEISYDEWMAAIEEIVPAKFLEMNKKAFDLGMELKAD